MISFFVFYLTTITPGGGDWDFSNALARERMQALPAEMLRGSRQDTDRGALNQGRDIYYR
ncbi:hypothetical protein [Paenibacillus auburnensis]|uniref:hypothetical protein n=1 Tax=Paenibacillus auburnensis TaxID=2905649 RepID=UPI001F31464C|nr:hypothetical protein [Paenibacillus auburnensis]